LVDLAGNVQDDFAARMGRAGQHLVRGFGLVQLQDGADVGAQFPGVEELANFIQPRNIYFH
jgi:hypothetical protein